jgi:CO/xanthine dehydrogenase FAD-binding subunit
MSCASITASGDWLTIGAAATFTDIRQNAIVAKEFPLLARAASWTGAIANQNRGTLGGNIVNASPAADSPPVLLVYEAEIELVSAQGARRLPYSEFHLGYKRTVMRPQELVMAVHLPRGRRLPVEYLRKVGTRNALAISKVALAGVGAMQSGKVQRRAHRRGQPARDAGALECDRGRAARPCADPGPNSGRAQSSAPRSKTNRRHSFHGKLSRPRGGKFAGRIS